MGLVQWGSPPRAEESSRFRRFVSVVLCPRPISRVRSFLRSARRKPPEICWAWLVLPSPQFLFLCSALALVQLSKAPFSQSEGPVEPLRVSRPANLVAAYPSSMEEHRQPKQVGLAPEHLEQIHQLAPPARPRFRSRSRTPRSGCPCRRTKTQTEPASWIESSRLFDRRLRMNCPGPLQPIRSQELSPAPSPETDLDRVPDAHLRLSRFLRPLSWSGFMQPVCQVGVV